MNPSSFIDFIRSHRIPQTPNSFCGLVIIGAPKVTRQLPKQMDLVSFDKTTIKKSPTNDLPTGSPTLGHSMYEKKPKPVSWNG